MRARLIFLACFLSLVGLVSARAVTFHVMMIGKSAGTGGGGGGGGGGPTAPTQAVNAGFTTLLVNFDFENNQVCAIKGGSSTLTCVAASPMTNWADCNNESSWDTSKYAHYQNSLGAGSYPCANGTVENDPADGKQSLRLRVPANSAPNTGIQFQTAHIGSSVTNTGFITWPNTFYVEGKWRIDATTTVANVGSTDNIWIYQNQTTCSLDFQAGELSFGSGPTGVGNSDPKTCGSTGHGFLWASYISSNLGTAVGGSWAATTAYLYGSLRTSNVGGTSIFSCAYVQNVFIVTATELNGCFQNYPGQAVNSNRSLGILVGDSTVTSAVNTPIEHSIYIHFYHVWSCSTAAATDGNVCEGSTQVGSAASGSVAYWHN